MSVAGGATLPAGAAANAAAMAGAELTQSDFATIAAIMQSDARIHLTEVKTTLVQSRLAKRLRKHGLTRFSDYLKLVESDAEERKALVVSLTTNHTHFFRESHHFDHLRESVMPQLKAKAAAKRPVRIWSAACSSGEEVYTVAMCLLGTDRAAASWLRGSDVRLLATDLAPHVVQQAASGVYSESTADAVPEPYRSLWMTRTTEGYQMVEAARQLVTAKILNLFEPWPLRQLYDVIFCRNVMIYFDDAAKAELEKRLVDQLAPGGTLYIGHSERLIGSAAEHMIPCGHTIYQKKGM